MPYQTWLSLNVFNDSIPTPHVNLMSLNSVESIVTRQRIWRPKVRISVGYLFSKTPRAALRPSILNGYRAGGGPLAGDRTAEREVDRLLPPSAEVKNEWSYNSSPPSICPHSKDRDISTPCLISLTNTVLYSCIVFLYSLYALYFYGWDALYLLLINCIHTLLYGSRIAVWLLYCMIYMADNMPIQQHVVMSNVTWTVPVPKCTVWLGVTLKHHHARRNVRNMRTLDGS
jgi:hypothetical protein